ncbi:MAG: D,D-heptose 1,7-bisphosphate phosphatase [Bryobacteraceae bacterium]|nr:MAG: D,D-heptose 1,7-bisphosphate phosphatase [Bryobacteraceae bacterium]
MKPCIFFDRDGTLIEERNYLSDPDQVVLIPGAAEAVRLAREAGYLAVVLTNQSGAGRGYFTLEDVERVNARMGELLGREGARIDGIYVCPHAPEDGCDCRKPRTGLVERAVRELGIDVGASWVVGDKATDLELARNAGMRGVLVRTGYGSEAAAQLSGGDGLTAADVLQAVRRIVGERRGQGLGA